MPVLTTASGLARRCETSTPKAAPRRRMVLAAWTIRAAGSRAPSDADQDRRRVTHVDSPSDVRPDSQPHPGLAIAGLQTAELRRTGLVLLRHRDHALFDLLRSRRRVDTLHSRTPRRPSQSGSYSAFCHRLRPGHLWTRPRRHGGLG